MFQSEKHGGNTSYKNVLHIEMHLSWAPPPHLSLFISLRSSVSLTYSSPTVKLCLSSLFVCSAGAPSEGLPSALELNREDGVIWTLPGGCQLVLGPSWPSGRLADVCRCQAHSAFPQWTSAVCGKAVEFACGCILILHLFGPSHAWPSKPAALLALLVLIALAWLAVCFWLHSLISIP